MGNGSVLFSFTVTHFPKDLHPIKSDLDGLDWAPGLNIPQLQWNSTDVAQFSGRVWVQGAQGSVGAWIDD